MVTKSGAAHPLKGNEQMVGLDPGCNPMLAACSVNKHREPTLHPRTLQTLEHFIEHNPVPGGNSDWMPDAKEAVDAVHRLDSTQADGAERQQVTQHAIACMETLLAAVQNGASKQFPSRHRVVDELQGRVETRQQRLKDATAPPLQLTAKLSAELLELSETPSRSKSPGAANYPPRSREEFMRTKRRQKYKHLTRRLRGKWRRELRRNSEWMKHIHYALARILTRTYGLIICPVLEVARIVKRANRNLKTRAARKMLTWSHLLFRQRLLWVAYRDETSHVLCPGEPGTTKTCTICGQWMKEVQLGDEVLVCPHCGVSTDRQKAGARNNFLAAYTHARGYGWDEVDDRGAAAPS
jgi:hypothetical protein